MFIDLWVAETVSAEHNKNGRGGAEKDRKIRGITPKSGPENHTGSYKEGVTVLVCLSCI